MSAAPMVAEVNHGRWIVRCECGGAELVENGVDRVVCTNCLNIAVAGLPRTVLWPDGRDAIDRALSNRPAENRNWSPGETVADLHAEEAAASASDWVASQEYRDQHAAKGAHCVEVGHQWPKRLDSDSVECGECGLTLPSSMIAANREGS